MNLFKQEIEDVDGRVTKWLAEVEVVVARQRDLARADLNQVVTHAADEFGRVLDGRIDKAKDDIADLVTAKLHEFKTQLSEAAEAQKRVAIRNASVGVSAAILVSLVSLATKHAIAGRLDALDLYRTIMFSIAAGYGAVMLFKLARRYFSSPEITRNSIVVGTSYLEILKPRGLRNHLLVFLAAVLGWVLLSQADAVIELLQRIR